MRWEFLLITIFSCIFQALILFIVYGTFGNVIFRKKIFVLIPYLAYYILICVISVFVTNKIVGLLVSLGLLYLLGIFYKMGVAKRIVTPLVFIGLLIGTEMLIGGITTSITNSSIEQIQSSPFFYMQGAIGSKIIVFFIVLIVRHFNNKLEIKGATLLSVFFVIMPIVANMFLYAIQELMYTSVSENTSILTLVVSLCFIFIIIAMIYIMDYSIRANYNKNQMKLINNALQEQIKSYNVLIENYKFNNKQMHDINNQITILKGMCKNDNNYIQEIDNVSNIVESAQSIIYTGISSLDAILNSKFNDINNLGIPFEKQIMLTEVKIDSIKLSILIANLLDNSIEESKRLQEESKESKITLKLQSIGDSLNIFIKNKSRNIRTERTAKANKFKHGYGTEIIKKIVEDFDGSILTEKTENDYSVSVLIHQM